MDILALFGIRHDPEPTEIKPTTTLPRRDTLVATDREVTTLEAVFRSLALLQTYAGQVRLKARRDNTDITSSLVASPDVAMSQRAWIIANVAALSTSGNAFWRIRRNETGAPINVQIIPSRRVIVAIDPDTDRRSYHLDGKPVADVDIRHLRYLTLEGEAYGLGPIQAARRGLAGMLQLGQYADELFTRGGIPSGILSTDQTLSNAQADAASEHWEAKQRAGKTAVLGHGLEWEPTGISPADLQWLDSQKWNAGRVARLFGIPPHKLGLGVEGAGLSYQNLEQASLDLLRDTLMGYLNPIEDALTSILPRGQEARFNVDAVLRPDTKTRYEAHEIAIRAGFLTVNEARAIEGRPALPDQKESDNANS